jgi:hypothetical protein
LAARGAALRGSREGRRVTRQQGRAHPTHGLSAAQDVASSTQADQPSCGHAGCRSSGSSPDIDGGALYKLVGADKGSLSVRRCARRQLIKWRSPFLFEHALVLTWYKTFTAYNGGLLNNAASNVCTFAWQIKVYKSFR